MNTKKSKHKKTKSINTTVVPVVNEICENLEDKKADQHLNSESEVLPTMEATVIIESDNMCLEDAPVKPKRKKGKKKKQEPTSDNIAAPEPRVIEAGESETTFGNVVEKITVESDKEHEIIDNRKKKKSKKKLNKTDELFKDTSQSTVNEFVDKPVTEITTTETTNVVSTKKHKKKKHSDHSELESCTSAFQKLLAPGDFQEESHLSDSSCTEGLTQDNTDKSSQSMGATLTSKKKKKHKKDKHKVVEVTSSDPSQTLINENVEEVTDVGIDDPKPKAVIAKPVDKKRKNRKSENSTTPTVTEDIILKDTVPEDEQKLIKENEDINVSISKSKVSECVDVEENLKKQIETSITLDMPCSDQNIDQAIEETQSNKTEFTESRPSRKKKRSGKHEKDDTKKNEINMDEIKRPDMKLNIPVSPQENNLKKEELNITPDLIQYPRSSSQQQLDGNNNMVIREINSPDQARLGIPILMSVPLIEGSGESPEVRSKIDPLDLEVTEIKHETKIDAAFSPLEQKSDRKQMDDVNLTIVKSMTELTELETNDSEVERQFTNVLEYNLKDNTLKESPLNQEAEKMEECVIRTPCENALEMSEQTKPEDLNIMPETCTQPVCPARKEKKNKNKKKGKKPPEVGSATTSSTVNITEYNTNQTKETTKDSNKNENKDKNSQNSQDTKGKQQSSMQDNCLRDSPDHLPLQAAYEPIEKFEDALTSSTEDINGTFEMIAKEASDLPIAQKILLKPEINITEPDEDTKAKPVKKNPVSQPKNLLGHPNIPAQSNKTDYKKEKNKPPNTQSAKVKIRDAHDIEKVETKDSDNKNKALTKISKESYTFKNSDDLVYKYSFRKVFLPNVCHVCMKELGPRVPCSFCNLLFYCSQKHKDEDWPQHQFLCFVVGTMAHLKDQKFIYGDAKNITGQEYRVLRMKIIISCEKMLKRKLVPWEQEALLYPRMCNNSSCREWRQGLLTDCEGCGQVCFCTEHPEHLAISHRRWCKSYALYQKLISHQQKLGRLEPKLPAKVMPKDYQMTESMDEVLASLYGGKLNMTDVDYAALTQIATAPLTAAYSYQTSGKSMNGFTKKPDFTIHIVGAELQFEADVLNKWEIFFLHLRPELKDLRVVLISRDLNPSNLPLDLLSKIKLCETCRLSDRRLQFKFIDKKTYQDYYNSEDFLKPDIVCSFNQSIDRASIYNGRDHWPTTAKCISKTKSPLLITSYTLKELTRDVCRVQKMAHFHFITEPTLNSFASVRPDRNFITDDEMPLLFKNYCYSIVSG